MEKLNFTIQNSKELKAAVITTQFQKRLTNLKKVAGLAGQNWAVSIGIIICTNLHSNMMISTKQTKFSVRGYGIYLNRVNFSDRPKKSDSAFNLPSVICSRGTTTKRNLLAVNFTYCDGEQNLLENETCGKKYILKEIIPQTKTIRPMDILSTGYMGK